MKKTGFALAMLFILGCCGVSARTLQAAPGPAQPEAQSFDETFLQQLWSPGDLAANTPNCRKVDVDLDEGYGVTGHVTRDECGPKRR